MIIYLNVIRIDLTSKCFLTGCIEKFVNKFLLLKMIPVGNYSTFHCQSMSITGAPWGGSPQNIPVLQHGEGGGCNSEERMQQPVPPPWSRPRVRPAAASASRSFPESASTCGTLSPTRPSSCSSPKQKKKIRKNWNACMIVLFSFCEIRISILIHLQYLTVQYKISSRSVLKKTTAPRFIIKNALQKWKFVARLNQNRNVLDWIWARNMAVGQLARAELPGSGQSRWICPPPSSSWGSWPRRGGDRGSRAPSPPHRTWAASLTLWNGIHSMIVIVKH